MKEEIIFTRKDVNWGNWHVKNYFIQSGFPKINDCLTANPQINRFAMTISKKSMSNHDYYLESLKIL